MLPKKFKNSFVASFTFDFSIYVNILYIYKILTSHLRIVKIPPLLEPKTLKFYSKIFSNMCPNKLDDSVNTLGQNSPSVLLFMT